MPDGLYERDALAWSDQQADLLRRIAAGERLNEAVDWPNVIEEVQDVGRSELRACEGLLQQALVHLLKLHAMPDSPARLHWRGEAVGFLVQTGRRFSPSMQQRISLPGIYGDALKQVRAGFDDPELLALLPLACPFALHDLLKGDPDLSVLLAQLSAG